MKLKKYIYGRTEFTIFENLIKPKPWQEVRRSWWSGFSKTFKTSKSVFYFEVLTYKKFPQALIITKRQILKKFQEPVEKTFALYLFN